MLSGFWRVSDEGVWWWCAEAATVRWERPDLNHQDQLGSHFSSRRCGKNLSVTFRDANNWNVLLLMSVHSSAPGGRNAEMEHYVGSDGTSWLNQNKHRMGGGGCLKKKHLSGETRAKYFRRARRSIILWEKQQEVKIKTQFRQNRRKQNQCDAMWLRASAQSIQFKFKYIVLPTK